MTGIKFTPVEEIPKIHAGLYKTFKAGVCRPLAYRRTQLHGLARMLQENADALADALYADLGKPRTEVFAFELHLLIDRATVTAQKLEEWAAPEHPECFGEPQKSWGLAVHKTPKGPVLMIAPWNYPYFLCLVTIIAAIAAGVPAALKPSEIAPASAQILADLIPKYIDPDAYIVVNGAVEETSKLLELKWAHISYTGGGRVGRVVAAAAAKHLTPITLELGGKSPVLIDPSYDIDLAAKRILFGKATNAGQTCVAPDYVLVTRDQQTALIEALQKHYSTCFPGTGGALASSSYGPTETALKLAPTVVADVELNDALMSEEIFGPLLPIVPVSDVNEAIDVVNSL
ncbi:Aldehyde/histidinol dehydrogenase [Phellopilus nigrolimitatus]|nr:Aldehyde/histidinol dehydrogenase [Phellopilus nigrolimitatus]